MAFSHAPLSVQELTDLALKYEYNPYIPLKNWLRTASSMQREVRCYLQSVYRTLTQSRRKSTRSKETTSKRTCCRIDTQISS